MVYVFAGNNNNSFSYNDRYKMEGQGVVQVCVSLKTNSPLDTAILQSNLVLCHHPP